MKNYGLIGKTLSHSFSKDFFEAKFLAEKIDATYTNFEIPSITLFKKLIEEHELHGLNVTIPYKLDIIPFLNHLTPEAKEIGAVNTIVFKDGKLIGANTDAFGFAQSIKPFLKNTHNRALILGSGGASKAVEYVLKKIGLDVSIMSRTPNSVQLSYPDANQLMVNAFKVIVNCTPLGTAPEIDQMPDFPIDLVTPEHLIIDLNYNPKETKFLKQAKKQGALILNGESMLKEQALKSYELWNL